jgi:hypothetical protein
VGAKKESFPPLLAPGRHRMTVDQLRALCVNRFPAALQGKRCALLAELERLLAYLNGLGLICEVWVNGSFVCDKDEPDDIDLAVAFWVDDADYINQSLLDVLNGYRKFSPLLDTYLCARFRKDDPRRAADNEDYWAGLWGKGRDGWLKGFVVIELCN